MKHLGAFLAVALAGTAAIGADGPVETWFDESLDRLSDGKPYQWVTAAGRWDRTAADQSVCSTGVRRVYFDTVDSEVKYRPCQAAQDGTPSNTPQPSPPDSLTSVSLSNTVLTAFHDGEEWALTDVSALGGISLRCREDASVTFIGWTSTHDASRIPGRWLELSAAGVEAQEGEPYDILIECDLRCTPARVRYSVNGSPLRDQQANEWFSVRGGSLDPGASDSKKTKKVSSVSFLGRGEVGALSATTVGRPTARAKIQMPRLALQKAGTVVSVSAVVPLTGKTVGANLEYAWYLTDAAGMRVVGSERTGTGASYTLAEADYGHWVTVDVTDESGFVGTGRFWFSNLPVVTIDCSDKKGWVVTDDATAREGVVYHWVDEDDQSHPLETAVGQDLAPLRTQYGDLYLVDVKTAWPTSKKEDHAARIHVSGNAKYKEQYASDGTLDGDEVIESKIHVRGNSTSSQDKKPYKIKLGKKADLFGLGGGEKNKHWVLLANFFDESLMRNKLCYDYSGELGLVSMKSEWVDVVMNGEYVGNYQLCQHIRVAPERVNIHDWSTDYEEIAKAAKKESNTSLTSDDRDEIETLLEEQQGWMTSGTFAYNGTNYVIRTKGTPGWSETDNAFVVVYKDFSTDISGGYIYEIDWKKAGDKEHAAKAASQFAVSRKTAAGKDSLLLNVAMNTPEFCFTNPDVSNEVWTCWSDIADAWTSGTGYDTKGRHYTELCDFDSMVGYWLSLFVPGNNDASGLSRYAYKDRGGKVVFGPAWDFDYGLGSLQIRVNSATVTNDYGKITYAEIKPTGWIPSVGPQNFMGIWTQDPYFMYRLREKYWATRGYLTDMVRDGGLIDKYRDYLAASARANDLRWNNRIGFFGNDEERGDVDTLKDFLTQRFAWLDEQFAGSLGAALPNLTTTVSDKSLRYVRTPGVAPTFAHATPAEPSEETDLADVCEVSSLQAVAVKVAVPTDGAAALQVLVDDVPAGTFPVQDGSADVEIPSDSLRARDRHLVEFIAVSGAGARLASNVALLTMTLPETVSVGEGAAAVAVTVEWLDEAWTKLAAADETFAATVPRPDTCAGYQALAAGASPLGKATTLWEDFVADTDPTDTNDVFTATIEMGADGLPVVKWTPDRPGIRTYTLRGANDLATDPAKWDKLVVEGPEDAASADFRRTHRFFTVEVSLPAK